MTRLDFQEVKNSVVNRYVRDYAVKQVANLKLQKDWKWGVAERLFKQEPINFELLTEYLSIPGPRQHMFSDKAKTKVEDELRSHAFTNFDFGRKKNKDTGNNEPLQIKSGNLQHENTFEYRGKHRGRIGSDLCPDFSVIFHRTKAKAMYRLPWMENPSTISYELCRAIVGTLSEIEVQAETRFHLNGNEILMTENNTIYRASSFSFKGLKIAWNEQEKAFEHSELGMYHISQGDLWTYKQDVSNVKLKIVKAFQRRKEYNTKERNFLERASKVFVTAQDSIEAGNCEIETRKFASALKRHYDKQPTTDEVNLRGDELLNLRNDHFTQRAVKRAIEKSNQ